MTNPAMEHYLASLWLRWQMRGTRPDAEPLFDPEGWLLTLCFRAKLTAWLLFLLFSGVLVGVLVTQVVAPQPQRTFLFEAICGAAFCAMVGYYLIFAYWYRVTLDEQGLVLCRFLVRTRRICWDDVVAFDYKPGDELLKLRSRNGQTVSLYLSLHGLSAVRRCLRAFASLSTTIASWTTSDPALMENVPSWRCDEMDLEDNPFDPLGQNVQGS